MRTLHINLKKKYPHILNRNVFLDACLYSESDEYPNFKRKSVLVLPGGGYSFLSYREKDPIMFAFLAEGFNAFALNYSTNVSYPIPHIEIACALDYIHKHEEEFGLFSNNVSLVGFSAGGHLAATYGYLYPKLANSKKELIYLRPYSLILGYPLISTIRGENDECVGIITNFDKHLMYLLSAEKHINKKYPPTFIFVTKTDECVGCHHSLLLRRELKKHNVKNKCIIYNDGPHGLSLANHATARFENELNKEVSGWVKKASNFINNL